MSPAPDSTSDDPQQIIADLKRQLAESNAERDEAQQQLIERTAERNEGEAQKAAITEVLGVINSSGGDLAPVFDAMLEKALRRCDATYGTLRTFDGESFHLAAAAHVLALPTPGQGPGSLYRRFIDGEQIVHLADVLNSPEYQSNLTVRQGLDAARLRSWLGVALRNEERLLGVIAAGRQEVRPFTDKQIALLQNFAAQAVIAMENARLITETREALEQQTATAEVLQVINSSPGELGPVFEAILHKAVVLCEAAFGVLLAHEAEQFHAVALHNVPQRFAELMKEPFRSRGPESATGRLVLGENVVLFADIAAHPAYAPETPGHKFVQSSGARSHLAVALRKDGVLHGAVIIYRTEVRPFTDRQIALLQSFAAQAVIAMENARLITETREALEQQTATAEVLGVINASPGDLAPVFDAMLERAVRLCELDFASLWTYDGTSFCPVAKHRVPEPLMEYMQDHTPPAFARLVGGDRLVHVADVQGATNQTDFTRNVRRLGLDTVRSILIVPLRKDETLLGLIATYRREAGPFSDKQIALLENFAAQAVIAMENARLITETREALEQQTATAEVLQVINSSPGDLAPVFDAILQKAMQLCGATFGSMDITDGELSRPVAVYGLPAAYAEFLKHNPRQPSQQGIVARIRGGEPFVHVVDLTDDDLYRGGDSQRRAMVDLGGARSTLAVALRKDRDLLGGIQIYRPEVRPFTDKQIALLQNFAAQAVIAMENARLITETREALEQQTATAEVLGVINSSPGELTPVFDAILEKALRLCGADFGVMNTFDGEHFQHAADRGVPAAFAEYRRRRGPMVYGLGTGPTRLVAGENLVHAADLMATEVYQRADPDRRALVDLGGARSSFTVALRKDDTLLGMITIYRQEVRPFSEKEIALLQNFAAQAVIAMENARLLGELRERTDDLTEALEYQTATSDVLQVISRSTFDLQPVLQTLVETVVGLCQADFGHLDLPRDGVFRPVARLAFHPEFDAVLQRTAFMPEAGTTVGRVLLTKSIVHVADVTADPNYSFSEAIALGNVHAVLGVPLLRGDEIIGVFALGRERAEGFTQRQLELVQTFADQALIAIENARLITETHEALEQQTATAEVLGVINASPGDLAPVFDSMLEKATRLCDGTQGIFWTYDSDQFLAVAFLGVDPQFAAVLREPVRLPPELPLGRVAHGEPFVQVLDMADTDAYRSGFPLVRAVVDLGKVRSLVVVPLIKDGAAAGIFAIARSEVRPFTDKQIALLQNFAAQAVIAMENARLITETREARDDAEAALGHLKAAQANLIQAEKMASLGQLTAGIAHEIKNPLNFVNNFAGLSVELLEELKEVTEPAVATLDDDKRAEVDETIVMLTSNLDKIAEHGRRADNIVKSMLEHSRGATGERREVDLNALVDEALNLAYHGARAQDQSFNITLERELDPAIERIEVAPQEMTRVFLNLFGNGFYAATKRARQDGDASFRPTLTAATRDLGDAVEVRVRDNGVGIPPEIRDKLFQPFFTTKPTGEGTGLGLSISYDIVTQQHGGTITVESEPGAFTEFTIRLPRH